MSPGSEQENTEAVFGARSDKPGRLAGDTAYLGAYRGASKPDFKQALTLLSCV